jgi:Mg2+/citrate symporter
MRFTVSVSINVVIAFICVLMGRMLSGISFKSVQARKRRGEEMTYDLASRKTNDEPKPSAPRAVWLLIFLALDVSVCMLSNTSASSVCFSF